VSARVFIGSKQGIAKNITLSNKGRCYDFFKTKRKCFAENIGGFESKHC
jgi:hypothetical protein